MKGILIILTVLGFFAGSMVAQQTSSSAAKLCRNISKIKELPRDPSEKGVDKVYDSIIQGGQSVVPCLITNITNVQIMPDPRCPVISKETKVGDVSYFILVDILEFSFTELFPVDVQNRFKTNGVYAYHEYIEQPGARSELQTKLRRWYAERKKDK